MDLGFLPSILPRLICESYLWLRSALELLVRLFLSHLYVLDFCLYVHIFCVILFFCVIFCVLHFLCVTFFVCYIFCVLFFVCYFLCVIFCVLFFVCYFLCVIFCVLFPYRCVLDCVIVANTGPRTGAGSVLQISSPAMFFSCCSAMSPGLRTKSL